MKDKPLGRRNYEAFADRYAEFAATKPHNAYYERPATLSLLPDVAGQRVLDAGCGPGFTAEALLDRGAAVVGVDVTPRMVELARVRVGDRATLVCHDLDAPLDFAADAEFGGVLCPLVLDYIEDWKRLFAEFARVLAPGGWLVFSCGHPSADHRLVQRRCNPDSLYFDTERFALRWGGFGQPKPLVTCYRRPLQAMLNPLAEAGFRLERVLEPTPTEDFRRAAPDDYEQLMREPDFICMRARR